METINLRNHARIRPFEHQNYPVEISFRFHNEGLKYIVDIMAFDQVGRAHVDISLHDLQNLNKRLEMEMKSISSENINLDGDNYCETLRNWKELAKAGNYVYKQIFHDSTAKEILNNIQLDRNDLSIQIISEDFCLPWETLYPYEVNNGFSVENFWGMKHIISRVLVQKNNRSWFVPPEIHNTGSPEIGLLTYDELPCVNLVEVPFFEKLNKAKKIKLAKIACLDKQDMDAGLAEFKGFLLNHHNITHFACHATYDDNIPSLSRITITNDFPISLSDFDSLDIELEGNPLVVLNACETGNLNALSASHFVSSFLQAGARGVIATECVIPDAFAADFAIEFYENHFLKGESLGISLLKTRRYFQKTHSNLSGLLYSMYASPNIQIKSMKGM